MNSSIDFHRIESNEHNIYVLIGSQVDIKGGKYQAEVVTLIVPVFFFPDVLELEAELWPNRCGLYVKVPSLPSPLYNQPGQVLEAMASAHDDPTPVCHSTMKTYKTESTRIASSQRDQFKIISVAFAKGTKCNNREFNEDAEGDCKLATRFATMTGTHPAFRQGRKLLQFPFSFGFWRMVVDGTSKQAELKAPPNRNGIISKLIRGVDHLNLSGAGVYPVRPS